MNFLELRKWKELLFVCIGVLSFCACSEDEKEWELIESEVTFGSNNLDAFGEKKVIKIKTNSYWEITANNTNKYGNDESNWITFDKTSGVGDAEIIATIPEYKLGYEREKKICILTGHYTKEGSKKTVNNVAGGDSYTWTVSQSSIDDLVLNSLRILISNMKGKETSKYDSNGRYVGNQIVGEFDYEIEYNTEDERIINLINEMATTIDVKLWFWSSSKYEDDYIDNYSVPFNIGNSSCSLILNTAGSTWHSTFYATISVKLNDGREIKTEHSVKF